MSVDTVALQAAQDKGLTVGVIPTDSSQALRLEIDDFLADADLANLYFLALEAFMKDDISSQPFSYYEISGIHGQPYRAWDGVENVSYTPTGEPPNKRGAGYCAHGSVLFPTWHRVYLAQFEVWIA
jgi:tyrosinase